MPFNHSPYTSSSLLYGLEICALKVSSNLLHRRYANFFIGQYKEIECAREKKICFNMQDWMENHSKLAWNNKKSIYFRFTSMFDDQSNGKGRQGKIMM